jgi:hypothetical protein
LCLGGLLVSVAGFKRGSNALDIAMQRHGWAWACFLGWFAVAWGGCAFAALVVTYWIGLYAP